MKDLEHIFRALANKRRLEIVSHLKRRKEASVSEIAAMLSLSVKAASKHLIILYDADILEREQRGLQMFYRVGGGVAAMKNILPLL